MNFTTIIFYLLIDHENHRHDVLERRRIGVEIGPEVVLQILTHLQNHYQLRIKPLLTAGVFTSSSGSFRPVILRYLREPIPLNLRQRYRASHGMKKIHTEQILNKIGASSFVSNQCSDLSLF